VFPPPPATSDQPLVTALAFTRAMARGFESKDVEYQQNEAARQPGVRRTLTPEERARDEARLTIELALAHARAQRAAAASPAHQQMLDAGIRALEAQLDANRTGH
jgi:hypothetical protein